MNLGRGEEAFKRWKYLVQPSSGTGRKSRWRVIVDVQVEKGATTLVLWHYTPFVVKQEFKLAEVSVVPNVGAQGVGGFKHRLLLAMSHSGTLYVPSVKGDGPSTARDAWIP